MDQVIVPTAIADNGDIMVKCPECTTWFAVTEATEDTSVTCTHCKHLFYPLTDCIKNGEESFAPVTAFVRKA